MLARCSFAHAYSAYHCDMLAVARTDTAQKFSAAAYRPQLVPDSQAADGLTLGHNDGHEVRQAAVYLHGVYIRKLNGNAASGSDTVNEKQVIAGFDAGSFYHFVSRINRISLNLYARDLEKHAHYKNKRNYDKKKSKRTIHVPCEFRLIRILALLVIIISIRHFTTPKIYLLRESGAYGQDARNLGQYARDPR